MSDRSRALPYAALVLQTTISAINYLVAKRAVAELDPIAVGMLRVALSAACFVPLLWLTRGSLIPERRFWTPILLVSLLGVPLNQGLFLLGLSRTSPSHAVLLYTLTPLFVFLIAVAIRTEKPEPMKVFGLILALAGAAFVVCERSGRGLLQGSIKGDLIVLLAVISWAGYTAFGKPLVAQAGPIAATAWVMLVGSVMFLPMGVPPLARAHLGHLTHAFWWALAYLVLLTSMVSYLCWYYALGRLESSRVAIFTNLQPVVTAFASWFFLGEHITPQLCIGGVLVVGGVVAATHQEVRAGIRTATAFATARSTE